MEQERELRQFLHAAAQTLGLTLTDTQIEHFWTHLRELLRWNKTTNLTSITDPYEIIGKHFVDSLAALVAVEFPFEGHVIDVGSGGGFPGIPLKIVRQDLRLTLIEPSHKKSSFLRSVIGILQLRDVYIFSGTIAEYAARDQHSLGDLMVVRALRFDEMAPFASSILKRMGQVVLYGTGRGDRAALIGTSNPFKVQSEYKFSLPRNYGTRVLTVLSQAVST
ncbi:MAG: putative Ribosomal small subunit methyltransferase [Nitrospira sp.]|nr:putative Ribosomal small subunit methyltransferase [Nitrospira sp.]